MFKLVDRAKDMRGSDLDEQWNYIINETPDFEEITTQMRKMKDLAPGKDGV